MEQFKNSIARRVADKMMQVLNCFLFFPQIRYAVIHPKLTNGVVDATQSKFMLVCPIYDT